MADALRARGWEVFWLGTRAGLEARVVPAAGIEMVWVSMGGMRGKSVLKKLLLPLGIVDTMSERPVAFKYIMLLKSRDRLP